MPFSLNNGHKHVLRCSSLVQCAFFASGRNAILTYDCLFQVEQLLQEDTLNHVDSALSSWLKEPAPNPKILSLLELHTTPPKPSCYSSFSEVLVLTLTRFCKNSINVKLLTGESSYCARHFRACFGVF